MPIKVKEDMQTGALRKSRDIKSDLKNFSIEFSKLGHLLFDI